MPSTVALCTCSHRCYCNELLHPLFLPSEIIVTSCREVAGAAIEAYRRAVEVCPVDYRAWYGLGQTYELLNMHS